MIRTILRVHAINLRRDRAAQILTFVVPIVFFTIFALIFGGRRGGHPPRARSPRWTRATRRPARA